MVMVNGDGDVSISIRATIQYVLSGVSGWIPMIYRTQVQTVRRLLHTMRTQVE